MSIILIIAGGVGHRMQQDVPKQFLSIYDKPVIIYTSEVFQKHPNIEGIEVVCLEDWHEILYVYYKQFNIDKLENIATGGGNGQASIRNGTNGIKKRHSGDDIVLTHDIIRPMVLEETISGCIRVCSAHGNSISVIPCAEAILRTVDNYSSNARVPRDNPKRTQTPQVASFGKLLDAHKRALEQGITNSVVTYTMFIELGGVLYLFLGPEKNIGLIMPEDIDIFKVLLNSKRDAWMH